MRDMQIDIVEDDGWFWWRCEECQLGGGAFGVEADAFYFAQEHGRRHYFPTYKVVNLELAVEDLKETLIRLKEDCGR